jgi:hypothetical protein
MVPGDSGCSVGFFAMIALRKSEMSASLVTFTESMQSLREYQTFLVLAGDASFAISDSFIAFERQEQ